MNANDLCKELKNKKRTVKDLIRYIKTRTDSNPNYSLMLGAGCSITSGIRSASELTKKWRKEVFFEYEDNAGVDYDEVKASEFLSKTGGSWYNPIKEYSSLFERKYDLPRQRRMFVETEVSNKFPSLGYAYLTKLVKEGYFNTVFTTNFDDLINEAFYQFSDVRPIVCAHDSGIGSITVTSKRPKVIKLHGDYLFDDIKSTLRETESLEENIKNKFIEFAKDFGLIVVGYGGGDRSIMDVLSYMLKHDDYYKDGIYWCLRKDAEIGEDLRKLLWKERAYFVLVDGFDELFAEINHDVIGEALPIETSFVTDKADTVINSFVENEFLKASTSEYIKNDLDALSKQQQNDTFFSMMKQVALGEDTQKISNNYNNDELMLMWSIENQAKSESYEQAINLASKAITKSNLKMKVQLNNMIAGFYEDKGERSKADLVCDELIRLQPSNSRHYIRKSRLANKFDDKLTILDKAIEVDPYYYFSYLAKSLVLMEKLGSCYDNSRLNLIEDVMKLLDMGIKRYPDISNRCWLQKFRCIDEYENNKNTKNKLQKEIIESLSEQNGNSPVVLELKFLNMDENDFCDIDLSQLLESVCDARDKSISDSGYVKYELLRGKILKRFGKEKELKLYIENNDSDERMANDFDYKELKSYIILEKFGKVQNAVLIVSELVSKGKMYGLIGHLVDLYIYLEKYDLARNELDNYGKLLPKEEYLKSLVDVYEGEGLYDKALDVIGELREEVGVENYYISVESYLYIKKDHPEKAKDVLRTYLDGINFNLAASVEVLNYELASKLSTGKYNKERLMNLSRHTKSPSARAAIYAVLGDDAKCYENLEVALSKNKIMRFYFKKWPAFVDFREKERFKRLVSE